MQAKRKMQTDAVLLKWNFYSLVSGAGQKKVCESLFIYNGHVSHNIFYIIDVTGIFRHFCQIAKSNY